MTESNLIGPYFTRGDVRRWVLAGVRAWIGDYVRDVERHEGLPVGAVTLPKGWQVAPDIFKWPETQLPAIIVTLPGLTDRAMTRQGDGSFTSEWAVGLTALVRGKNEADAERIADVYGSALILLMLQQAGGGEGFDTLDVVAVEPADESYDEVPQRRSRTLVAATVTFRVELRGRASAAHGPSAPSPDPTTDPGPLPEVTDTELTIERRA